MTETLDPAALELVDRWQRDFPLTSRPYRAIGEEQGLEEGEVLAVLARLSRQGILSRVGATVRPNTAGASLLAAMAVPRDRLDEVAAIVNVEPGVNHNYEREHAFNLWFVLTGADRTDLDWSLARIRHASGLDILELPLERSYYIDLGFPLDPVRRSARAAQSMAGRRQASQSFTLTASDRRLLAVLEPGLQVVPEPYKALAWAAGMGEEQVLVRLGALQEAGIITRLGLIVRHREIGYRANAMSVWSVPDAEVDRVGELFAAQPFVTLCYRRPRRLPDWPYNLFCMIHGQDRETVAGEARSLTALAGLEAQPHAILFSSRCFRQRGARLRAA